MAFLSRAEYRAELRDDNSLRGEANWEFTLQSSKRAFARLDDCQLALGDYRWLPGPGATDQKISGEDERAIVGNDEGGRLYAVVDRSGKMACNWSLSAMHDTAGALSFALTLPACPLNTLQLSLPGALSPVVDHGIVTLQGKESGGKRNWRIELGGNNHSTLRIINTETAQHRTSTTLVRHSFAYEITPRGLEIVADIKLDVLGAPLRQFRMSADAPLTVVMARMGENELSLGKVSSSTEKTHAEGLDAPATEYLIDLPEPVQGAGRLLRISAIAPVSWDSLWRLPVLHFPDAIWQEGTAKLIVAKPIVLDELQLKNCRQIGSRAAHRLSPRGIAGNSILRGGSGNTRFRFAPAADCSCQPGRTNRIAGQRRNRTGACGYFGRRRGNVRARGRHRWAMVNR